MEKVQTVLHPLEPLTAGEIRTAVSLVKKEKNLGETDRFVTVTLQEPPKDVVFSFEDGDEIERKVFMVILNNDDGKTYEAIVSVTNEVIDSWTHIPGVQPQIMPHEFIGCEEVVKKHPDFIEALSKRDITDMDIVAIDPLTAGHFGYEDEEGVRLARTGAYIKYHLNDNHYARPIQGIVTVVDLNKLEVIRVEDYGITPIPPNDANYTPDVVGEMRTDIKTLDITQPDGPSFEVEGHQIFWQKWDIRFGFNPREGLVLHQVKYDDDGEKRDVLYRASLSEMVVPYGDPDPTRNRMNAFDVGEYGMGASANSLKLGCDCLGEIQYFPGTMTDSEGNVLVIPNAVCLHEEDAGILWKHTEWRNDEVEVRRSRRLVLSFISTVGNYEYAFYWHFYQDGRIDCEVKATGIVNTVAIEEGVDPKYGTLIAPQLSGVIHQHFFNMRLDMNIDGQNNSVYEVEVKGEPVGENNPYGSAFYASDRLLKSELEAQRNIDINTARFWKVTNPSQKNYLGQEVGYKLETGSDSLTVPFAQPESPIMKRASFMKKHLWVTPFDEDEKYAGGDYPNQHSGDGLENYTQNDRSIENTDIVLWHTLGMTHVIRVEEWPIMPVTSIGFSLKPFGFFDANPSLDVPATKSKGSKCHHS